MPETYEPDEFDKIAQAGGPVGVHRAPRKWYVRLLPALVVFIVAGLIAYLFATFLWNQDNNPQSGASASPSVTATESVAPSPTASSSPEPSVTPSETTEPSPSETAEPEPVIIYNAQIHVRNGSGISGLAGKQEQKLEAADYTEVAANNINASLIPDGTNTVTYTEDRLKDTAEDVATTLGIDAVQGGGTPGGAEIEVLLASDPDA
ncbi:LytR C-terminal domain-containing protein [Demequina aurantiaca]|uniref:LytR C-terminal domain-containing protein n=1 Tax=Demequina aurantiaca TaxID=676200 RepID=UPI000780287B|nr:LytR C-terminal domain-containing protein [Demequina aurantiaca]